ncbi:hypothetical protein WKE44_24915 [Klebsiella pneumoniae]|uniref:hypothetical protein n=1 Tax=Klebsiella pneumoniae TaxID=573 RepID=UPI0030C437AE
MRGRTTRLNAIRPVGAGATSQRRTNKATAQTEHPVPAPTPLTWEQVVRGKLRI